MRVHRWAGRASAPPVLVAPSDRRPRHADAEQTCQPASIRPKRLIDGVRSLSHGQNGFDERLRSGRAGKERDITSIVEKSEWPGGAKSVARLARHRDTSFRYPP